MRARLAMNCRGRHELNQRFMNWLRHELPCGALREGNSIHGVRSARNHDAQHQFMTHSVKSFISRQKVRFSQRRRKDKWQYHSENMRIGLILPLYCNCISSVFPYNLWASNRIPAETHGKTYA